MGRRIEVELTSTREDGSWTWRAAGAKQPKGDLLGSLLYEGAKVGDVVKVEAEFHLDGIEVTEVFAPKQKKERTDLLELKSRPLRDDELVTTQRVARGDRRGDRRGRGRARGEGRGERRDRNDRQRGPRPEAERRPKPKRLRPRRVHRDALLAEITEEHRPIVEQVMRDGMPGVRAAIEKQNAEAKAAGKPEVDPSPILAIAEKNLGPARLAEWRDRADAAIADGQELDIRDLRSVVVAGSDVARDDETRGLVDQIKTLLDQRLESDHATWLKDLDAAVEEGRVVRGLRLSSRPVKAGAPLPTEVASKLAEQASQALAPDVAQDRWATVLDALAFSPVRGAVAPVGLPSEPGEELLGEVRRLSDRIPAIAALFGIDPAQVPKSAKRRRSPRRDNNANNRSRGRRSGGGQDRPVPGAEPKPQAQAQAEQAAPEAGAGPRADQPAADAQTTEAAADTPVTDAPSTESATAEPTTPAESPEAAEAPGGAEVAPETAEAPVDDAPGAEPADTPAVAADATELAPDAGDAATDTADAATDTADAATGTAAPELATETADDAPEAGDADPAEVTGDTGELDPAPAPAAETGAGAPAPEVSAEAEVGPAKETAAPEEPAEAVGPSEADPSPVEADGSEVSADDAEPAPDPTPADDTTSDEPAAEVVEAVADPPPEPETAPVANGSASAADAAEAVAAVTEQDPAETAG